MPRITTTAGALLAAAVLSGCGGNESHPSAQPTTDPTVTGSWVPAAEPSDSVAPAESSAGDLILTDLAAAGWDFDDALGDDFADVCDLFDGIDRDSPTIYAAGVAWVSEWNETAPARWDGQAVDIFDALVDSCYSTGLSRNESDQPTASTKLSASDLILADMAAAGLDFDEGFGDTFVKVCQLFGQISPDPRAIEAGRRDWARGWDRDMTGEWAGQGAVIFDVLVNSCYSHDLTE